MNELKILRSCTLVLLALGTAGTGWGTVAACATTAPGTSISSLGTGSATSGCYQDDLSYTALNLTGGTSTGGATLPTTGNTYIYSTGIAANGNTVGPVNLFVEGGSLTGAGTSSETGTVAVQATANTGTVGGISYSSPTGAGLHWAYSTLTLTPSVAEVDPGDTVTITENFCINASQAIAGGGGCTAADHGTIIASYTGSTTAVFTCAFGTAGICLSATSAGVNFGAMSFAPTTIAITDLVSVNHVNGTTVTLTNFEDSFGESSFAPEPPSFTLMGAALASLGYRRRKRQF
jgi:hypothetical protein